MIILIIFIPYLALDLQLLAIDVCDQLFGYDPPSSLKISTITARLVIALSILIGGNENDF